MKHLLFIPLVFLLHTATTFSQTNTGTIDSVQYVLQGKILSKDGNIVKVQQTDSAKLPLNNKEGILSKYFEKVLFGTNVRAWLNVGKMKVISVEKDIVTFNLLEEKSTITISGQKEDYFKPGSVVKFIWKEKKS